MTNIVWTQSALQTLELVYLQTLQYTKNERIIAVHKLYRTDHYTR